MRGSTGPAFSRHLGLAVGLGLLASLAPAFAEPPATAEVSSDSASDPVGTTDEGWLEEHGFSFELVSRADVLSKVRGGLSDSAAIRYRGHLDLVATVDTGRLGLWPGGRIVVVGQNGHGQGMSADHVGDVQTLSNIEAHSFTQLSEWWLEQAFLDRRVRVKLGRQDAGADFACVEFGGEFHNSSFGLIPTAPVPTFPDPAPGVSVFADLTDQVSVGAGLYAPMPVDRGRIREATLGVEIGFTPRSSRSPLGRYRLGLWLQKDPLGEGAPDTSSVYLAVDQTLYREGPGEGLRGFLQLGTSTGAPNGVSGYLGGGLAYTGLLPGRRDDSLGAGVAHARLPTSAGAGRAETDLELFYRARPWPWLTVQPTLHYVLQPGGDGRNALVVGVRVETRF